MKRLAFILVWMVALVLAGATTYADSGSIDVGGPNGNQSTMGAQPPPSTQSDGSGGATDGARQATNAVSIRNLAFVPPAITVPVGTTVTWTNQDTVAHTVTSEVSGGPASGTLQPGQSYSFTFNQAGTFSYCSSLHPTAKGTVTVTGSNTPTLSAPVAPSQSQSSPAPSASASASSSSSSSSISNTFNTFNNVMPTTSSKQPPSTPSPSPPPVPPETPPAAPPTPPPSPSPQENQPAMPNTGAAGTVTAFASVAVIGTGLGYMYIHLRRKLYRG